MKILVIGGGGREHALAWKASQNVKVSRVYVAPGNAGTASNPDMVNVAITDIQALLAFAKEEQIALTIVGPEAPLSQGVVDVFREAGMKIFGPNKAAAQLESSKDFAKAFMLRHGIPTAHYQTFSDAKQAHDYVNAKGVPIVIKADGLAAGKGVVVAMQLDEAHQAIDDMLLDNKLGDAGARVVIEEFLAGEEASFMVMVDHNKHILPLATSQDHKRLLDDDKGPNTGGMGAYSPAPIVTPELHAKVMREIIKPTVEGMAKDGIPYTGFLYAGLMINAHGDVKTLEFNCRMGDPETQPILMRLKTDLVQLVQHAVDGNLNNIKAEWDRRFALGVVMASAGYPEHPTLGDEISGLPTQLTDVYVFHAGTALKDNNIVTSGGRVLCVSALGETLKFAQQQAYRIIENIAFKGAQYRKDIGYRVTKS